MNEYIKQFINSAKDLENIQEEKIADSLQILSSAEDVSVFEPGNFQVNEFFCTLQEVFSRALSHPAHSELAWRILSVLQVAMRNPGACGTLTHTYSFIPSLTALMDTNLPPEKQLVTLKVMQELSYGIIIRWQESHLPRLVQILLEKIKSNNSELVQAALSVMVNICHKNKPAVYTLMNTVNIKVFLRTILNLQRENMETSVQVCKLVMVLDDLSGGVPETDIVQFIRVSFKRIKKAFSLGNTSLMRHVVDFFRDAKESSHGRKVLLTYSSYLEETRKLIETLSTKEPPNNWQCVHHLMEFLVHLVDLELPSITPLFGELATQVLPWLRVSGVTQVALELLSVVLRQCQKTDLDAYTALCSILENNLEVLVDLLHSGCKAESLTGEEENVLTSLLQLLSDLAADVKLFTSIAEAVEKEELKKLLLPLVTQNCQNRSHIFQQSVIALYVEVMSFVSKLSLDDKDWLFMYSDLLQKKQILKAFAVGLYFGSYEVKKKILFLAGTTSFSKECIITLSKFLSDLGENQLGLDLHTVKAGGDFHKPEMNLGRPQLQMDFPSPTNRLGAENLNQVLDRLRELIENNQIQDTSLAGVIELYNYKLSEMSRAERTLQSSLAAADNYRGQLTGRVNQLITENTRLHQLLYTNQLALESKSADLVELRNHLTAAQEAASTTHFKYKQFKQEAQSKSVLVREQGEEIIKMKAIIESNMKKLAEMDLSLKKLTEEKEEQTRLNETLESKNSDLKSANVKLEEKVKTLEKEISEQKRIIAQQTSQLQDLERTRKLIFEISAGKKNLN